MLTFQEEVSSQGTLCAYFPAGGELPGDLMCLHSRKGDFLGDFTCLISRRG